MATPGQDFNVTFGIADKATKTEIY